MQGRYDIRVFHKSEISTSYGVLEKTRHIQDLARDMTFVRHNNKFIYEQRRYDLSSKRRSNKFPENSENDI